MRFTKIPLIATLMAVALSLLIVLPTLAQVSGDRTDGRLSQGDWFDVRIADNLDDLDNGRASPGDDAPASIVNTDAAWAVETSDGANDGFDARDTYFNGDLYVSNKEAAFNTILITAKVADDVNLQATGPSGNSDFTTGATDDGTDQTMAACLNDGTATGSAIATIRNSRGGAAVTAYLIPTTSTDDADTPVTRIYQGVVEVWDQEESIEKHDGPCDVAHVNPTAYQDSAEQQADAERDPARPVDDANTADVNEQEVFDDGYEDPANADGWTHNSAAVIPARDGDTLTITVKGVAGAISVVVDGDAPEIEAVSPASGVTKENAVNLQFTVSDDGSGIRYDGESGSSTDPDLQPQNGDGDQRFDEPITVAADAGATPPVVADGATEDIKIYFDNDDDSLIPQYLYATGCSGVTAGDPTDDAQCDDGTGTMIDNAPNPAHTGIAVYFDAADDESSAYGSNAWTQASKGMEYSLDMRLVGQQFGTYYWQVTAKDRVGNSVTTDGDEDTDGKQPFKFSVDDAGPRAEQARTGVGYEAGKGEFPSRSWVALNFLNEEEGGADTIDAATVEPGDFTVGRHTVVQAVVPSETKCAEAAADGKDLKGLEEDCLSAPRSRIYLQLSGDLASDETPTIQLLGGAFKDAAGNNNITDSFKADDKIAPGITITITGSATGRAASTDKGSFDVRVTSDEDLSRFPRLYFATIEGKASITNGKVGNASGLTIANDPSAVSMSEVDTNVWEKTVKVSTLPGTNNDNGGRILAVIVTAADDASPANSGNSAGWKGSGTPGMGDGLDFKKLDAGGFLVEIDNKLPEATVTVRPAADPSDPGANKTESANPYIEFNFAEADEYGISVTDDKGTTAENAPEMGDDDYDPNYDPTADDEMGVATKVDIGDGDTLRVDSHRSVDITSLGIAGVDIDEPVEVDPWKYVIALTGLEISEYTIVYTAQDDLGNDVEDVEVDFEVLKRQPYEVELDPGWNLISIPGDPFNPAVGEVIGSDLKANTVLGFQGGEWLTSVRNDDGRWQGTLTDIEGGHGYWVQTTVVETISTVIPPILPNSVLPTVDVISGWNLIGVVDPEQHPEDTADAMHDADDYLTSLNGAWRVAYSFATQQNQWMKLLPDTTGTVANGKGYWLWSRDPGTLVP